MKISNIHQYESLLGKLEADVHAKIRSLFARCPTLHGFAELLWR